MMNKIAAAEKSFAGVTYNKLAAAVETINLANNGISYKNQQGVGAHLALVSTYAANAPRYKPTLPNTPQQSREGELTAVPVTKLYDQGTTLVGAGFKPAIPALPTLQLNPATAARLNLTKSLPFVDGSSAVLKINGLERNVIIRFNASISNNVVLIHRSFGLPIAEPVVVELLQPQPGLKISAVVREP